MQKKDPTSKTISTTTPTSCQVTPAASVNVEERKANLSSGLQSGFNPENSLTQLLPLPLIQDSSISLLQNMIPQLALNSTRDQPINCDGFLQYTRDSFQRGTEIPLLKLFDSFLLTADIELVELSFITKMLNSYVIYFEKKSIVSLTYS